MGDDDVDSPELHLTPYSEPQCDFMWGLFVERRRRNPSVTAAKILNTVGEVGGHSRLWGFHCGDRRQCVKWPL